MESPGTSAILAFAREFYARGWMAGTAGNLSIRDTESENILITGSGADKGEMSSDDLLTLDFAGNPVSKGKRKPSAETSIHLAVYANRPRASAVFHVHTVESTVLSMRTTPSEGRPAMLWFTGYEMIKGLGVWDEGAKVGIPVFRNHGDVPRIAREISDFLMSTPEALPVFLIEGHGLTSWGTSPEEARNRLEIAEFLCACELRRTQSVPPGRS